MSEKIKARPPSKIIEAYVLTPDLYVQLRYFDCDSPKPPWKITSVVMKRVFYCHRGDEQNARGVYERIRTMMAAGVVADSQSELITYLTVISEGIDFARSYRKP